MKNQRGSAAFWVIIILIIVVVAGAAWWYLMRTSSTPSSQPSQAMQTMEQSSAAQTQIATEHNTQTNAVSTSAVPTVVVAEQSFGKAAGYTKDSAAVYYGGNVIQGADPSTFTALDDWYAKDANTVYFRGSPMKGLAMYLSNTNILSTITGIDPASFVVLTDTFVKDKAHVYEMSTQDPGIELVGVDAPTFTVLCDVFEKDSNHVYDRWGGDTLVGADPATFTCVNDSLYGKDARHAWYMHSMLSGADPATFSALTLDPNKNQWYAKDDSHVWYRGDEISGADAATFTLLNEYYAKDTAYVYFNGVSVAGADSASFQVTAALQSCGAGCQYDSSDKSHDYRNGQIVSSVRSAPASLSESATIDQSSLVQPQGEPTMTGSASGVAQVYISLDIGTDSNQGSVFFKSDLTPVVNGHWTIPVSEYLSPGSYTVHVYDPDGAPDLTSGVLTVQ